ncbi:MAG: hypothetical protein AB7O80_16485 [Acetobacteraceae bacterium]
MGNITPIDWRRSDQTDVVTELPKAELVMLLAMRWWVRCLMTGEDPMPRLTAALTRAGARDAAYSIDGLMGIVARTGQRPVDIRCPRCPALSEDEAVLLHAARLAQIERADLAERHLRLNLLTSHGAKFAIGPLEGAGMLFLEARMIFGGRRRSAATQPAWVMPEDCSRAVH